MRDLVIEIRGNVFDRSMNRSVPLYDLPQIEPVRDLWSLVPNMPDDLVRVLASGAFDPYDIQLIIRVINDHSGFRRTVVVETYSSPRTVQMHIAFKMNFEADVKEAERSMLAATVAKEPPISSSRRVSLRRGISGS